MTLTWTRLRTARPITSITPRALYSTMASPRFSPDTDSATALPAVQSLLATSGGRWTLTSEGQAVERVFKFKTFAKTWDFMTAVALQAKIKNHHPEWSNTFNTTFIRWTTHSPRGLSHRDIDLAAICDGIARDFGEIDPEPAATGGLAGLADQVTKSAGDCCVPKKAT